MTFLALPSMFNRNNSQQFQTLKDAKKFLDEKTGYVMKAEEWCMIGKIMKIDENGQLISALDIRTISM
jgi:hypothetical protein